MHPIKIICVKSWSCVILKCCFVLGNNNNNIRSLNAVAVAVIWITLAFKGIIIFHFSWWFHFWTPTLNTAQTDYLQCKKMDFEQHSIIVSSWTWATNMASKRFCLFTSLALHIMTNNAPLCFAKLNKHKKYMLDCLSQKYLEKLDITGFPSPKCSTIILHCQSYNHEAFYSFTRAISGFATLGIPWNAAHKAHIQNHHKILMGVAIFDFFHEIRLASFNRTERSATLLWSDISY